MKCETAQRLAHLAASGEISAADAVRRAEHESACADCRRYGADMRRILAGVSAGALAGEPDAAVLARIAAEIRRHAGERPATVWMTPPVRWLAYAAGLLILVAVGYWRLGGDVDPGAPPGGIEHASAIVAMVSGEPSEFRAASKEEGDADLRALALQILRMEGLHIEDGAEEEATSGWEPTTKNPQSHSTGVSHPAGCV